MQPKPLVTVITPVHNGAEYLDDLICSVRDQGYLNIEHIVIDDGSTDNGATVEVLKKYPHLRWWSHPNKGQYATMNEGLLAAQGDMVCFICADDLMEAGAIEKAVKGFVQSPGADIVYGRVLFIDKDGLPYPMLDRRAPLWMYPYFTNISHSSLYAKKSILLSQNIQFRTDLKYTGDYDWIIRLIHANLKFFFVNFPLSQVRKHERQSTAKYHTTMRKEQKQVRADHHINRVSVVIFAIFDAIWAVLALFATILKLGPRGLSITFRRWYYKYLSR